MIIIKINKGNIMIKDGSNTYNGYWEEMNITGIINIIFDECDSEHKKQKLIDTIYSLSSMKQVVTLKFDSRKYI